jgi:DNA-binding transcriptional LysR family regulator
VLTVEGCRPLIRTGDYSELMRDVRARELDLVVGETEPAEAARSGLAVELIYRPSLVAIALAGVEPNADWSNLSLLEYRASSVYYWEVAGYLQRHGLTPTVRGEVDDSFLMVEAALRGGFVAFVPKSVARPLLRSGQVKTLATLAPETAGIFAVYPENEVLQLARKAVALLIENARARLETI